jgi:hypothetical protein
MGLLRKLMLLGKWPAYLLVFLLCLGFLSWIQVKIGFDGWSNIESIWSDYGSYAVAIKYLAVVALVLNWKKFCRWYGDYSGNVELSEKIERNWHLFLIPFVAVEVIGFLR